MQATGLGPVGQMVESGMITTVRLGRGLIKCHFLMPFGGRLDTGQDKQKFNPRWIVELKSLELAH